MPRKLTKPLARGGLVIIIAIGLGLPATAGAAGGDLTYQGCVSHSGAHGCATPTTDAIDSPDNLAFSPDGHSLYVSSGASHALNVFTPNADGSLTFASCVAQAAEHGCTDANHATASMGAVAVSADGADVYGVALDTVIHFNRDPTTGALTFGDCIGNGGTCTAPPANEGSLSFVKDVAVSPDGTSVYAISDNNGNDKSITNLARNPTTGALTYVDCLSAGTTPTGCAHFGLNDGFNSPSRLAISPDSKNVYVTQGVQNGSNLTALTRNTSTGTLSFLSCYGNTGTCDNSGLGEIHGAQPVTVSPNGASVYIGTGFSSDSVRQYLRNPSTGALSFGSCVANAGAGSCADPPHAALDDVTAVTMSADGKTLYAIGATSQTVANFAVAADGSLTMTGCIGNFSSAGCADTPNDILSFFRGLVSPDGKYFYATSFSNSAIVDLSREPVVDASTPPDTTPPPGTTPPDTTDRTPPETKIDKGPKKKLKKSKATFTFSSTEAGVSFECKLDKADFEACTSPVTVKKLKPKKHSFQVRAIDSAGNIDASPATIKFKVVKKKHH